MSRSILILLMIAVVSLQACKGRGDTAPLPVADTLAQPCDTIPRISVTFIMGRDLSAYNPYYSLANQTPLPTNITDSTPTSVPRWLSIPSPP